MSIISRLTTWTVGQILKSADLNGEFNNLTNLFNNIDGGTTAFNNCNSTTSSITTLTPTNLAHGIMKYRRPNLQYGSGTVVNLETGIDGTSGESQILFNDGSLRKDSNSGRINCNLAQVAALSGAAQSGLRTGSVATNTNYAFYAVKTTDNANNFVTVADVVYPIQANFATLNTNFGTNGWVYLGYLPNGDNSGSNNVIPVFNQNGAIMTFSNVCVGQLINGIGIRVASTAGATSITWTVTGGSSLPNIPNHINTGFMSYNCSSGASGQSTLRLGNAAGAGAFISSIQGNSATTTIACPHLTKLASGLNLNMNTSVAADLFLYGFIDPVLGVSGNAIL